MQERRASLRAKVTIPGRAVFVREQGDTPCLILNVSPVGACVSFPPEATVPRYFDLKFGREPGGAPVRVVWRRGETVGVAFLARRARTPEVMPG